MHRSICWGIVALFISANAASAAFVATLKGSGNVSTVPVPLSGGTFDLSVTLARAVQDTESVGAFGLNVTANIEGFAILNGVNPSGGNPAGIAGNATTGTRYNDPEWYANYSGGSFQFAGNPDLASGMLSPTPNTPLGEGIWAIYQANNEVWNTTSSLFGFLSITLVPGSFGHTVSLEIGGIGVDMETFEDVPFQTNGVTFTYVPESESVLLMGLCILPLINRKRQLCRG